jgi:hypothetical protein
MPRLPVGAGGGNGDAYETFCKVLSKDDGHHWDSRLRDAGFTVLQAV